MSKVKQLTKDQQIGFDAAEQYYLSKVVRLEEENKLLRDLCSKANHYLSMSYPENEDGYETFREQLCKLEKAEAIGE